MGEAVFTLGVYRRLDDLTTVDELRDFIKEIMETIDYYELARE